MSWEIQSVIPAFAGKTGVGGHVAQSRRVELLSRCKTRCETVHQRNLFGGFAGVSGPVDNRNILDNSGPDG
jgi:hypothetical protein